MQADPHRRVFVAGASGAIGRPLCRLLVGDGWHVFGTTRSVEKTEALQALGITPIVVDVFDAEALQRAMALARADVVVHQLTDLPLGLDPTKMAQARLRNARIREEGTRHLVQGAIASGARRLIAQSIAFAYAPGPMPFDEAAPLSSAAPAVISLEQQVLAAPLLGIVLRYGRLYGPGTGFDAPPSGGALHVDAAADAARRAVTRGMQGVYNIAEADGTVATRKAQRELGWDAAFRIGDVT